MVVAKLKDSDVDCFLSWVSCVKPDQGCCECLMLRMLILRAVVFSDIFILQKVLLLFCLRM